MKKSLAITLLTLVAVASLSLFTGCIGLHTHSVEKVEAVPATCTEDGNIEYYYCEGCGKYFSDQSFNEISKEKTILKALGHTYEGEGTVVDATCTKDGLITKHCTVCNEDFVEVIPAPGHDLENHEAKAPTCEDVGWGAYQTCKNCDHTTYQEVPAKGHTKSDWIIDDDATCLLAGSKHKECTVCHDTLETEEIPAPGHDLENHEAKAPTCVNVGWEAYQTCKNCDHTTYQEIPATGEHTFVEGLCSVCGKPVGDDLSFGGEGSFTDSWYYWNDQNWCDSNVVMKYAVIDNGTIKLSYTSEGFCWFGMQLFYKNTTLENGKKYTLTLKIKSSVAGDVTVNGQVVSLVEGDNSVSVEYTEGEKSSVSIQFGKNADGMITAGDFIISDVQFEEVNNAIANGGEGDAVNNPGEWIYWVSDWVNISNNTCIDNVVTITFANNAGYWYDTQLFYKNADNEAGITYTLKLKINSTKAGRITVNSTVINLVEGEKEYEVTYTESANASISIQLGVDGENDNQDIKEGTIKISDWSFTEVIDQGGSGEGEGSDSGEGEDTPSEVATATISLVMTYGDYYFHMEVTASIDLTGSNIKINGETPEWVEISGANGNTLKVKVVKPTETTTYNIEWLKDDVVIAKGSYVCKVETSGEGEGSGSGETSEVAEVKLEFVEFYGDHYFHFKAETTCDMKTVNYVKVNGTQRSCEVTDNGDNKYTLKMYVADNVTAGEYTFEWVKDGNIVATGSYTYAPAGSGEGEGSGSEEAVTATISLVERYGDGFFFLQVVSSVDLKDSDVNVNGAVQSFKDISNYGVADYAVRLQLGNPTETTTYNIEWLKDGVVIAKGVYTYTC